MFAFGTDCCTGMSAHRSLYGVKRTLHGSVEIDMTDPSATSARISCCSGEAACRPWGGTRHDLLYLVPLWLRQRYCENRAAHVG